MGIIVAEQRRFKLLSRFERRKISYFIIKRMEFSVMPAARLPIKLYYSEINKT